MREVNGLLPELVVENLAPRLRFWCGLRDFRILYGRPEDGFARPRREPAEVMLEQFLPEGRHWRAGVGWPLVMEPEETSYRAGDGALGQLQFVVADPDGYRLRFAERLGFR